jgi:RNA polymerase sigma-70 factor (ECF subfamily)
MINPTGTKEKTLMSRDEFGNVYDTHAERIYNFIYYKTLNREVAEDITSHTFLKALENLHQYDSTKGTITVWLYRIARNLVIDHYRKKRATVNIDDVWDLSSNEDVQCDIEIKVQIEELKTVLSKLPAEQRDIIILRVWQDLPYSEIALIMQKSEGACKMMFSRIIARLREEYTIAVILLIVFADILR